MPVNANRSIIDVIVDEAVVVGLAKLGWSAAGICIVAPVSEPDPPSPP